MIANTGLKTCPYCKIEYTPKYRIKAPAKEATIHDGVPLIYVEQHISGACSDKCWDELFPPVEEEGVVGEQSAVELVPMKVKKEYVRVQRSKAERRENRKAGIALRKSTRQ
jgi:hypothetical protein